MIKSMTGYGSYESETDSFRHSWEIRSVNGKQLGLRWRLPNVVKSHELDWEKKVREWASRGRVDIELHLEFTSPEAMPLSFNRNLAESMISRLEQSARAGGHEFQPDYNRFFNISSLWQETGLPEDDRLSRTLKQGLAKALQNWDLTRIQEGQALCRDLKDRVSRLSRWVVELESLAEGLARDKFEALKTRLGRLLEDSSLEENRLYQELALIADKLDVSEELTRLSAHFQTLTDSLETENTGGRELDFLLQECFREINTCGNKAQDVAVSQLVVKCKNELERCREQVQNLE